MSAPRLEINLSKILQNAEYLVRLARNHGIAVTGVTKACLGSPSIADALVCAGVSGLGDSRVENLKTMAHAGVSAPMILIRSPMMSQADLVVRHADISFNTELDVIKALSEAARRAGRQHGVVLMVELGDLREGIMPGNIEEFVHEILQLPNLRLAGIGTNLACRCGVVPDTKNMTALSTLVTTLEKKLGVIIGIVSGGNSANLHWLMSGCHIGRINDIRLGESILLGREPLHRTPIPGLHTSAFTLVAEVIESKIKPSMPTGTLAQTAFGEQATPRNTGNVVQSILAIGRQDIDPMGLHAPSGIDILDASSDHLIVSSDHFLKVGGEVAFQIDYSALLRGMTSPYVRRIFTKPYALGLSTQPQLSAA